MNLGLPTPVLLIILEASFLSHAAWFGPAKDDESGSSYYISEALANEPDAAHSCRLNGWILATVTSASQQKTIEKLADTVPGNKDIWIGLRIYRERVKEIRGYGIWSDGRPFNVTKEHARYHNWKGWEPHTYRQTTQTNQPTCVRLWQKHGWQWDDYYCAYEKAPLSRFACESKKKEDYVTKDLQRISTDFVTNSRTIAPTYSNLQSLSNAINELLTVDEEFHKNNKSLTKEVTRSLDNFLNRYDAAKQGSFHEDKKHLEINVTNIAQNDSYTTNGLNSNRTSNNIQIYLSPGLIKEAAARKPSDTDGDVQVNTVFYRNPSLFQVDRDRYQRRYSEISGVIFESRYLRTSAFGEQPTLSLMPVLVSDVMSVDVKDVTMDKLENPVCVSNFDYYQDFSPPQIPDMIPKVRPVCAFWDFSINEWSTKGCRTLKPMEEKICGPVAAKQNRSLRVTCACNHMTHFSILLDTTYTYAPKYLTHITKFGCSISIICLIASIATILIFKQLRKKTAQQILLHLCITLLITNVIFLTGIDQREDKLFCTVTSALLHYFLLASWGFMLLEATFLFLRLVMYSYKRGVQGKIVPIGATLCYVVPGLIAGIAVGVTRTDAYLSEKYCWLSMQVLIPSLLVPVALILTVNIFIFVTVIYTITFRSKMFRKRVNLHKIRQALTRAFCMIFILGLPWLFGFFMLLAQRPSTKEAFAGVAIFFFFCARQEQVRKLWLVPINQEFRKAVRRARSSKRSSRRTTSKAEKYPEDSSERSHSEDTGSKTMTNERSFVTYPSSQTTVESNTVETNTNSH